MLEKNVCSSVVRWSELDAVVDGIIQFYSLVYFHLVVLSVIKRGLLKSLAIIVVLYIYSVSSSNIVSDIV